MEASPTFTRPQVGDVLDLDVDRLAQLASQREELTAGPRTCHAKYLD